MLLNFNLQPGRYEKITNYELFTWPNGIYRAREIQADNYLYPMYYLRDGGDYLVSSSVYALIHAKQRFVRQPRFQTTHFYRPSFLTIDAEVMRARTTYRRSTMELLEPGAIIELGARLIQEYVSEIEARYPGWVHILSMGGKDSENIILARRRERWIVLSGEPNAPLNETFLEENGIEVERFVPQTNDTDNSLLREEIIASDCMFDPAHFRWVRTIRDLVLEHGNKAVLWLGTSGDGVFSRNNNHRDRDYYAVHDLHVGMAMGIWHQMFKNILGIPVVSPYQSPRFLDTLFYRFDPYFVDRAGDVRPAIGALLLGREVKYPRTNPRPEPWQRDRGASIGVYLEQLKQDGIPCRERRLPSWWVGKREAVASILDRHSSKRRTRASKVLFPLRRSLGKVIPAIRNTRHDISAREIC